MITFPVGSTRLNVPAIEFDSVCKSVRVGLRLVRALAAGVGHGLDRRLHLGDAHGPMLVHPLGVRRVHALGLVRLLEDAVVRAGGQLRVRLRALVADGDRDLANVVADLLQYLSGALLFRFERFGGSINI